MNQILQPAQLRVILKNTGCKTLPVNLPCRIQHLCPKPEAYLAHDLRISQDVSFDDSIRIKQFEAALGKHPRRRCLSAANTASEAQLHWPIR